MQPNTLRVFVLTCDPYTWALKPFAYLFQIFWSSLQPVVVGGFTPPPFALPPNFQFFQIDTHNYPPNKWSDGLIKFLRAMPDEHFCLMLEDYWLCRTVDHNGIRTLLEWQEGRGDNVRMDLTADRLYGAGMHDVGYWGHYDIIECAEDAPYQMSLQAAIWKKSLMLQLLEPGRSSWETEIHCNMVGRGMRVYGSRQYLVRYANGVYQGTIDWKQIEMIPEPHRSAVRQWIPSDIPPRK